MADLRVIDEASNPPTQMPGFLKRKRESSQFAGSSLVAGNQPSSSTGLSRNACMSQDQSRQEVIGGSSNVARGPISNASCSSPDLDLLLPSDFDQVLSSVRRQRANPQNQVPSNLSCGSSINVARGPISKASCSSPDLDLLLPSDFDQVLSSVRHQPANLQHQVPSNLSCGSSTSGTSGSSSANQDSLLLNDFNKVLSSVRQQRSSTQDQVPTCISTGSSAGWNDHTGYYQSDQYDARNGSNVANGQSSSGFNSNNYYYDNNNNNYYNYNINYNSVYNQPLQFQPTSPDSSHGMVTMPMGDQGKHSMLATGNGVGVQNTFHGAANRLHTQVGSSHQDYIQPNAIPKRRPVLPVAQQNISGASIHPGSVPFGGNLQPGPALQIAQHQNTSGVGIPSGNGRPNSNLQPVPALQNAPPHFYKGPNLLPESAKKLMQAWMQAHIDHPFPEIEEKKQLALEGGITVQQVTKWFFNERTRKGLTKPIKEVVAGRRKNKLARAAIPTGATTTVATTTTGGGATTTTATTAAPEPQTKKRRV